ncbi:hypothetical protein ACQPVP_05365 [Clostridium nigeriense]|uniref:hypothetical protein n=1 Tax=Clostridium nigeriense TaxID=1805470 RepID=UPI003D33422E
MVNLRNIRISFLYIIKLIMFILVFSFLISGIIDLNILTQNSIKGGIILTILSLCIIGIFSSLLYSIKYIYEAYKVYKIYNPKDYIIKWTYTNELWSKFIINNFKLNFSIEIESLSKAAIKFYSTIIPIALIFVAFVEDYRDHYKTILSILLILFIIGYFLPIIIKMFISMLDHIIFTNKSIILNENYIIINEEIFPLNIPKEKQLESKKIINGNIEIKYATISRSATRYDNRFHLNNKDVHLLIIPIPKDKISEAKLYINK